VTDELLAVGRIARAHGIRGEVSVEPLTEIPSRFEPGSVLRLEDGRTLTVEAARPHQQWLLVRFHEVPDRTAAEALRGGVLLIAMDQVPPAPEGSFWIHEVVGLEVITEDGRSLGRIREVQPNPANDLWVTEDGAAIPANRELVTEVDVEAGRVRIRDLPDLST
jgi:16S rRNA processing protein RimM